jgi:GDSL-like Lipase/Acylhydrolase family
MGYASIAQIDTIAYPFIRTDRNHIIHPDSISGLQNFWSGYSDMLHSKDKQLNIVHFGGSHIQADIYTNYLRVALQTSDSALPGARGFLFPYSAVKTNNPFNYKTKYQGTWTGQRSAVYGHSAVWGVNGVTAITEDSVAAITFLFRDSIVRVQADAVLVMANFSDSTYSLDTSSIADLLAVDTTAEGYLMLYYSQLQDSVFLPFKQMDTTAILQFYGCVAQRGTPGIVYHSLGGNGSSFRAFNRCELFTEQLRYLQPDMAIISIGTNDTSDPDFDSLTYEQNYAAFIDRILEVNPNCALLLTVPNDNYLRKKYHNENLDECRRIIYRLAQQYHGAVWDFYGIMGEAYSAKTWRTAHLMKSDLIHFTNSGYLIKGELLYHALMEDYMNWQFNSGLLQPADN